MAQDLGFWLGHLQFWKGDVLGPLETICGEDATRINARWGDRRQQDKMCYLNGFKGLGFRD